MVTKNLKKDIVGGAVYQSDLYGRDAKQKTFLIYITLHLTGSLLEGGSMITKHEKSSN